MQMDATNYRCEKKMERIAAEDNINFSVEKDFATQFCIPMKCQRGGSY